MPHAQAEHWCANIQYLGTWRPPLTPSTPTGHLTLLNWSRTHPQRIHIKSEASLMLSLCQDWPFYRTSLKRIQFLRWGLHPVSHHHESTNAVQFSRPEMAQASHLIDNRQIIRPRSFFVDLSSFLIIRLACKIKGVKRLLPFPNTTCGPGARGSISIRTGPQAGPATSPCRP